MEKDRAFQDLVDLLRHAYSGELAAGYAYRGHWKSVRGEEEKVRIREIEDEEWRHRRQVGQMLADLGNGPSRLRECRAAVIGRILGLLCHVAGYFAPMYGAGKLESRNVREYENAARFAALSGYPELVDCLLAMAEVEWEHERYFRSKVEGHPWLKWFPLWPALPPKESIRAAACRD